MVGSKFDYLAFDASEASQYPLEEHFFDAFNLTSNKRNKAWWLCVKIDIFTKKFIEIFSSITVQFCGA